MGGKNPFPKSVNDTCRVLAGWKNKFSNNEIGS